MNLWMSIIIFYDAVNLKKKQMRRHNTISLEQLNWFTVMLLEPK